GHTTGCRMPRVRRWRPEQGDDVQGGVPVPQRSSPGVAVMKRVLVLAAVIALAACGDDIRPPGGGGGDGGGSGSEGLPPATFTTFVIDLILNQTANNTQPKAFVDFSTLPDPDGDTNNLNAYKSLFP